MTNCYITAVVRCAPPKNKPKRDELSNCREYLINEFNLLRSVRIILTLGHISFKNTIKTLKILYPNLDDRSLTFKHGVRYKLFPTKYILYLSYHPSRQNTQTRRLTWEMWITLFNKIKQELDRM